jgi:hypothetical protein
MVALISTRHDSVPSISRSRKTHASIDKKMDVRRATSLELNKPEPSNSSTDEPFTKRPHMPLEFSTISTNLQPLPWIGERNQMSKTLDISRHQRQPPP